jgi:hypothetical protein
MGGGEARPVAYFVSWMRSGSIGRSMVERALISDPIRCPPSTNGGDPEAFHEGAGADYATSAHAASAPFGTEPPARS